MKPNMKIFDIFSALVITLLHINKLNTQVIIPDPVLKVWLEREFR